MDPTGSRRYLCVEMTGQADMSGAINYRQMYAQAVWELAHGEQYWFDNDDEREITRHNAIYPEGAQDGIRGYYLRSRKTSV